MTSQQNPPLDLTGALKRQWWIVALAAVVAIGVVFAASSTVKPTSTATGTLRAGPAALGHGFNAPTPDDMVRSSSAEIRTALLDAGVFSAGELARVRFAAVGAPQTRISITASAADPALAKKLVDAAAKQAVEYSRMSTAVEIERQKLQIEVAKAAIAAAEKAPSTVYERYELQSSLIDAESGLRTVESIYTWDGNVSVASVSGVAGRRTTLAMALLLGAFVGLVLGAVREYLWRRKNSAAAAE